MSTRTICFLTVVFLSSAIRNGRAQEKKGEEPPRDPPLVTLGPPGTVVAHEHWRAILPSEDPPAELAEAEARLKQGDFREASLDIRKAAEHTRTAMAHSKGALKDDLAASVGELDALAWRIERGDIPADSLGRWFGRDLEALAAHHAEKAREHWAARHDEKAGNELRAAGLELLAGTEWGNPGDLPRVEPLAKSIQEEAGRLIDGKKPDPRVIERLLDEAEGHIDALKTVLHTA